MKQRAMQIKSYEEILNMGTWELYKYTGGYTEPSIILLEGVWEVTTNLASAVLGTIQVAIMVVTLPITPLVRCLLVRSAAAKRIKSLVAQKAPGTKGTQTVKDIDL